MNVNKMRKQLKRQSPKPPPYIVVYYDAGQVVWYEKVADWVAGVFMRRG